MKNPVAHSHRSFSATCLTCGLLVFVSCSAKDPEFTRDQDPSDGESDSESEQSGEIVILGDGKEGSDESPEDELCREDTPDFDQDGYTVEEGDCNDCDANANPGAFDVPDSQFDEDCNGVADDVAAACDGEFAQAADDPFEAAGALGLCKRSSEDSKDWGLIDAKWVNPDGAPADPTAQAIGRGVLDSFGTVEIREGTQFAAISSGEAREAVVDTSVSHFPESAGESFDDSLADKGVVAPGFPVNSARCEKLDYENPPENDWEQLLNIAHDPVALEIRLRVPSNAKSLAFDFNFHTSEFPEFICTRYNDFFVVLMDPPPPGALSGNISFDTLGQPVSVNNGLLQVCEAQTTSATYPEQSPEEYECPLGVDQLENTGFEGGAATGWLSTEAPVVGGSIVTLRFALWDSFDHMLDSTVLIDNFRFSGEPAETVTKPAPDIVR